MNGADERQTEVFIRVAVSAALMPIQIALSFLLGSGLMMLLLLLGLALSPFIALLFTLRWTIGRLRRRSG